MNGHNLNNVERESMIGTNREYPKKSKINELETQSRNNNTNLYLTIVSRPTNSEIIA
jgi:hypothetical protein